MHDISLPEHLYQQASKVAKARRVTLEEFVAYAVETQLLVKTENLDHLFTDEVLACVDKGAQEAKDGKSLTMDQVSAHFDAKRKAWEEGHAR